MIIWDFKKNNHQKPPALLDPKYIIHVITSVTQYMISVSYDVSYLCSE